jgi:hypothetical protein
MAGRAPKKFKAALSKSKASGVSPALRPAKAPRIYTKAALRQDPMQFGSIGFGNTGLESPSILGMGRFTK